MDIISPLLVLIVALGVLCGIITLLWKLISFLFTTTTKVLKSIFSVFTLNTSTIDRLPVDATDKVTKEVQQYLEDLNKKLSTSEVEKLDLKARLTELENHKKALIEELSGGFTFSESDILISIQAIEIIIILIQNTVTIRNSSLSPQLTQGDGFHKTNQDSDSSFLKKEIERLKLINEKLIKENTYLKSENEKLKQELIVIKSKFKELSELVEKSKSLQDKMILEIADIADIAVKKDTKIQLLIAAIEALEETAKKIRIPPLPPRPFPDIGTVTVISSNVYSDNYINELEWYVEYLLLRLYKESSKVRFFEEPEYSYISDIADRLDLVDFFMYQLPDEYEEF
ncbi:MAG: hypothetical protein SAJ72_12755 [Jaaginema sp. PMC 1080.18]|nr:hypothetical protein [Jaaginema sp. PMC 1080.18]